MSALPIVLRGEGVRAVVVGGGAVGRRKAAALLAAEACVRVVEPSPDDALRALAARHPERLTVEDRPFADEDVRGATLVVAATGDSEVDARVAAAARTAGALVNVAGAPERGDWVSPATHRAGALTVAVTAGGVPGVAVRVRDELARRFDDRYAHAVATLGALRLRLLRDGKREAWRAAEAELVGAEFCAAVEQGRLAEQVARWR